MARQKTNSYTFFRRRAGNKIEHLATVRATTYKTALLQLNGIKGLIKRGAIIEVIKSENLKRLMFSDVSHLKA